MMPDAWTVQNTNEHQIQTESSNVQQQATEQNHNAETIPATTTTPTTTTTTSTALAFEDNFVTLQLDNRNVCENSIGTNCNVHQPLPDSASYLRGLERKLERLKKGTKLVTALTEKRQDCLRTLLQDGTGPTDAQLELDTPISIGGISNGGSGSAVHELYRHLNPVQAVTTGELVHIVQHDQLEEQQQQQQQAQSDDEQTTTTTSNNESEIGAGNSTSNDFESESAKRS